MLNKFTLKVAVYKKNDVLKTILKPVAILLLALNPNTFYANENYIDEDSLFDEVETVFSATRLKQEITKAPVSVTIIDRKMIEASGAVELYELFRLVPGYFSYSVSGSQFGVTSHFGATDIPTRLEVRIDGRSVHQALFDTVDWASLGVDISDIDHIEVVRGTSSPVYGSNAFLGAINIVTKGSLLQKHQTTMRGTVGSINTKNVALSHAGRAAGVEYFLTMNAKRNTGFAPFIGGKNNPVDIVNDSSSKWSVNLQGTHTPTIENSFKFDIGFGTNNQEIPLREDPRGFSNRITKTNHQHFQWIRNPGNNESTLSLHHNYLQIRDDSSIGLLSTRVPSALISVYFPDQVDEEIFIAPDKGFSERIDIEYEKKHKSSDKLNLVFGVGARKDVVKSDYLIGDKAISQNIYRGFANADFQVSKKLNFNAGFLVEKSESNSSFFSPRLAMNYQLSDQQTIRSSIAKGLHAPAESITKANVGLRFSDGELIDLLITTPEDTEILPEKIHSYELAYLHRWPETNTQLDLKLFYEDIEDIINTRSTIAYPDVSGSVQVYNNNGYIKNKGLELQLEHKFTAVPDLDMRLAYAYIDSEVGSQNGDDSFRLRNSIPKHSATLMMNKKTKSGYRLGTTLQYQSDIDDSDEQIKRVDFNVGKNINFGNAKTAKLNLILQNVFNHYNDFSIRNDKGMRTYMKVEVDF